jgi:endonuclease/exonuclease/phosphatase (EEP) superfamily protein YafD
MPEAPALTDGPRATDAPSPDTPAPRIPEATDAPAREMPEAPATTGGPAGAWRRWAALARPVGAWGVVAVLAGWLAVRVSGVGAGTWVETVIVLTPYVALASVVGFGVIALLRERAALVASGACCVAYALVMAAVRGRPRTFGELAGPDLQVMTVNVQFGWGDPERVVELVELSDVDLLGVQEVTPAFHERLLAAGIEDRLPHSVVDDRPGSAGTALYSRHPVDRTGDHVAGRHENPTALGFAPPLALDHVLVDRSIAVDGVSIHGVDGSDHRAVVADLRLPAADDETEAQRRSRAAP